MRFLLNPHTRKEFDLYNGCSVFRVYKDAIVKTPEFFAKTRFLLTKQTQVPTYEILKKQNMPFCFTI